MTKRNSMLLGWAASIVIGMTAGAAAIGTGNEMANAPFSCEIEQSRSGGMILVESVVTSDTRSSGHYSFTLRGPGTNISQGGAFEAGPGETLSLGTVMVGANGTTYDAELEVNASGQSLTCTRRIGSV